MLFNTGILFWLIKKIRLELLSVLIIGLLVCAFTTRFRDILSVMAITIPAFIGTGISVILSFKLNKSYDRWWEGRKIWGAIVNDSSRFLLQLRPTDTAMATISRAIEINICRLPGEKEVPAPCFA